MANKPKTPPGLGASGRALWRGVLADCELRADELVILEKAARTADDVARIEAALAGADLTTQGVAGQARAHPLLAELRAFRLLLDRLLRTLAIPDPDEEEPRKNPAKVRAAESRWARDKKHQERKGWRDGAA